MQKIIRTLGILLILTTIILPAYGGLNMEQSVDDVIKQLVEKFGIRYKDSITTGVSQVAKLWQEKDGSIDDMTEFCLNNFIIDENEKALSFQKITRNFEQLSGLLVEMDRSMTWGMQIDEGPMTAVDALFSQFSLSPYVGSTLFDTKIAFWVLLNFPVYSTGDCARMGKTWSAQKWAEVRLAQTFEDRIPAEVSELNHSVRVDAENYISNYNIPMHSIVDENGARPFPEGLNLITHWGLRDELKAQYQEKDGLKRQEIIYDVMKKIITQEIPAAVINNPKVDWNIAENTLFGESNDNSPEPDTRYQKLRNIFLAEKKADPHSVMNKTFIDRKFNSERRMTEERVKNLFEELLGSDEFRETAKLVKSRLGRNLRPFDIWYNGFKTSEDMTTEKLSAMTMKKYPTAQAFWEQMPEMLMKLGFSPEKANFLQANIQVDPSRGAGHAMEAGRREDKARLRTRIGKKGMDYKGYNIAVHEFGHNVEQTFSLHRVENTLLQGVPNTAFTEAFAFYFQERDLELLGMGKRDEHNEHLLALQRMWGACEIAAVSLVEMRLWHWMYDHENFTPEELKQATLQISKDVWNEFFAGPFGAKDEIILGIYSHMIEIGLYLPDYPLGHIIHAQYEAFGKGKNFAQEMERMCSAGAIDPDIWMLKAIGTPVSSKPLRQGAREAIAYLRK
ncbi:MAG: hypothetical protein JXQ65_13270 [Candidatus Marinimicrobia bacterium]|nr:hypothetical protein [Candidatus Neomarinimicrobiota bacterium]